MNIRTKIFLTVFIMVVLWLCIVLLNGTYALAGRCNSAGWMAYAECMNPTPLTPQYPNPNDNPNNYSRQQQMQDLQREQDRMNQFFYNQQLRQQLQQQQNLNGHIWQQEHPFPMK